MREMKNAYNILVGKPEGKRQLARPRRRWDDNIRMDLREIGWEVLDCMHVVQDRDEWLALVKTARTSEFHKKAGNSLTS
jgi:hypothetical protein